MTGTPQHIPSLDGWRAVAISMLLYGHAVGFAIPLPFNPGFCAVNLFFVLSGFLITHRLLTEYSSENGILFGRFYTRRAFRILPPIALYLVSLLILGLLGILPRWDGGLVASALFARNYIPTPDSASAAGWFTGHFWSLAVEEHFYLLWPLALHVAGFRRAKWAAIGGILLCTGWRFMALHYGVTSGLAVPFYFRTDTRFDALLIGSLLGVVYSHDRSRAYLSQLLPKRDTYIVLALYAWVLWRMFEPADWKELFLVAALLAVTALHPDSYLARFLNLRPVRWIGQISYSLYIWQQLFLVPGGAHPLGSLNHFPWKILAIFALASVSYYCLELPMMRIGRRLTSSNRRRPVTAAATA